jgi:hypothetical protein
MRVRALMFAATVVGLVACEEDEGPNTVTYTATLSGANERPAAVTTNGSGTFTGTFDPSTNVMTYTVQWQNLGTTSTLAHIHGPILATSGNAALPVLVDFDAPTSGRTITHGTTGSATGTINFATITTQNANINADSLKKLLDNGAVYVNVHTTNNGGGEIAGVITRQ